eukprot:TRINITY_DN13309_c0_g1_i1.p1 TRINITY_DN13309_c0_g1~~TRINITY_DN13309_c0_g1_i1.p1  ORF type:complete len:412 (-),score=65.43 TRINITY_DN13309_c0_g1_i1:38-1273(-)
MPRQIQLQIPEDYVSFVVQELEVMKEVHGLASFDGGHDNSVLIIFRTLDKETDFVLGKLELMGVGIEYGVIDILALQATRPKLVSVQTKKWFGRRYRYWERMTIEEIHESIDAQNHLTFNYLIFVITAALISTVGLATNSPATVVASMLLSPLMGPIMAITFGTAIRDWAMTKKGIRNEFTGFLLTFLVGLIWGFVTAFFPDMWDTNQQTERGTVWSVVGGVGIAIPSGLAVAVATTGGGISALVGVAISAALLPPISNCGMYLAYALAEYLAVSFFSSINGDYTKHLHIGLFSGALFLVNFVFIYIFALFMFYIKRVKPRAFMKGETLFPSTAENPDEGSTRKFAGVEWNIKEKKYQRKLRGAISTNPLRTKGRYTHDVSEVIDERKHPERYPHELYNAAGGDDEDPGIN